MQLMIVDDCYLIMGSANVNDRSMLGSRDSELAIFIEGEADATLPVPGLGNILINSKIHDFRRRVFEEHFGADILYPAGPQCWDHMWNIARTNTEVFHDIFKVFPDNRYRTFNQLANRDKTFNPQTFINRINEICGHAVLYPYQFLEDEALLANKNSELQMLAVPLSALY